MLSCVGFLFVDLFVGRECLVGDDEVFFHHGLPPCRFGWSANCIVARFLVFAVARLVVARAMARMLCVLSRIRLTMGNWRRRLVRR